MTQADTAAFEFCDEGVDVDTVVAGFSAFGLAGLTAADYLAERLELEPCGHLTTDDLPTITPFEGGRPHHHTRILSRDDLDLAVLHGGMFVPTWAAPGFSKAVLDWTDAEDVREAAVLAGIPIAHAPDDHRTFHVATQDYYDARLRDHEADVPGMANGFLDGVNAALVERGMTSDLAVAVFVTPVHDRVPDVDAAIRLVETTRRLYDLDIDTGPLEKFAADVEAYYARLHEQLQAVPDEDRPDDRMFM